MSPCIFDKGPRCHGLDRVVGLADSVVDVTVRLAELNDWFMLRVWGAT